MKAIRPTIYQTPDQLDTAVQRLEAAAAQLPMCETKQTLLAEIDRLRSYATMKRLLTPARSPPLAPRN